MINLAFMATPMSFIYDLAFLNKENSMQFVWGDFR